MRFGFLAAVVFSASLIVPSASAAEPRTLRAGAAKVDVTPRQFPVIMNGNFFPKNATGAADVLYARGLVLDDGATKLAIVVVDACMMERSLVDAAKALASEATGIPTDRMLVSATHTHSSPSGMGCLGTPIDEPYSQFLRGAIADCIKQAAAKLVPARIGATSFDVWTHTFCRAWIRRPDKMLTDPFGNVNVRSNMHPGYQSPDVVGPVSPVDPEFSLLSVQTANGKPLALLANYSMHYFGVKTPEVSSDYTGRWCRRMEEELGPQSDAAMPFVAVFSQGTSGDSMWMDYSGPKPTTTLEEYTEGLVKPSLAALPKIEYSREPTMKMAETKLTLRRRVPDEARLKWAKEKLAALNGAPPKDRAEVYAQEAIYLHENPERELKLQAVRVGDFGIAAIPNEVFALSGLKIKRLSPLVRTMNVELANGSEGYIPPPEHHPLGGYTTWPARTAALEVQAETKIVEAVVGLLEKVSEQPRRDVVHEHGPYAKAVLESKPVAYWRLNEWGGETVRDASGNHNDAKYVGNVAHYLPGAQLGDADVASVPRRPSAFSGAQINRSVHFAGGHLEAKLPELGDTSSVEFWFWVGADLDGVLYSRGAALPGFVDRRVGVVFLREQETTRGFFSIESNCDGRAQAGSPAADLQPLRWYHFVLTCEGRKMTTYLDGKKAATTEAVEGSGSTEAVVRFGISENGKRPFAGRLDEIAVYPRVLSAEEVAKHYAAAKQ